VKAVGREGEGVGGNWVSEREIPQEIISIIIITIITIIIIINSIINKLAELCTAKSRARRARLFAVANFMGDQI
jgi:hypothetical protein